MADQTIGFLHPGEMGASIAKALVDAGHDVLWASDGRSAASRQRADDAGLRDVGSVAAVCESSSVIISVCPPRSALDVAQAVVGFQGLYLDANAIAPETSRAIGALIEAGGSRYVDGGIIGPPVHAAARTHLYLSGSDAKEVAQCFASTEVDIQILSDVPGAASALKMAYAAWTKGTQALLLGIRALARSEDVEEDLLAVFSGTLPDPFSISLRSGQNASTRGWRWVGEMQEIASTFEAAGLPGGFHEAAAEIFERSPHDEFAVADEATLNRVIAAIGVDPSL